jgi:hypothetical protein
LVLRRVDAERPAGFALVAALAGAVFFAGVMRGEFSFLN